MEQRLRIMGRCRRRIATHNGLNGIRPVGRRDGRFEGRGERERRGKRRLGNLRPTTANHIPRAQIGLSPHWSAASSVGSENDLDRIPIPNVMD